MDVGKRVAEVVSAHFDTNLTGAPDLRFDAIANADSLDILEVALLLEDEFDIDLVDAPITLTSTVGDLIKIVEERARG